MLSCTNTDKENVSDLISKAWTVAKVLVMHLSFKALFSVFAEFVQMMTAKWRQHWIYLIVACPPKITVFKNQMINHPPSKIKEKVKSNFATPPSISKYF